MARIHDSNVEATLLCNPYRLVGLVVKASASRAEDPGSYPACATGFSQGRVIPVT